MAHSKQQPLKEAKPLEDPMTTTKPQPCEGSSSSLSATRHSSLNLAKDRLSDLPDEILRRILALLLMREAVATSTLSRRWEGLWRSSVNRLRFDPEHKLGIYKRDIVTISREVKKKRMQLYAEWVNGVLEQVKDLESVEEFRICADFFDRGVQCVDEWIRFAVRRKVQSLHINLCDDDGIVNSWDRCSFPPYDFTSEHASSVRLLRLRGVQLIPPGLERFTSLTSLTLLRVPLKDELFASFVSSCTLLETLCVRMTEELENPKLVGPSLKLKHFELGDCDALRKIEISAPNLVSFRYGGRLAEFAFESVPELVAVHLNLLFYSNRSTGTMSHAFSQLDSIAVQLKTLVLETDTMEVDSISGSQFCPVLDQLRVLVLVVESRKAFMGFPLFMNECPFLQKFELHFNIYEEIKSREEEMKDWKLPPLKCLREIELSGFSGHPHQMELAVHLLEGAVALEKITVATHEKYIWGDKWVKVPKRESQSGSEDYAVQRAKQLQVQLPPTAKLVVI